MTRKKVVFNFLGVTHDVGLTERRWERWRPTVALFGHESFQPDCMELLILPGTEQRLIDQVTADVVSLRPQVQINLHHVRVSDPWNYPEMYLALHEYIRNYRFDEQVDYYVHLTTGTRVAQITMFRLTDARYLPARFVDTYSLKKGAEGDQWRGRLSVLDLDLSSYDRLVERIRRESADTQQALKGGIETRNAEYNRQISRLENIALKSQAPLLLTGPTGTGKTKLARRVHDMRARRHLVKDNFVEVNCATLERENVMSTLFGHKKGSFTGATSDRTGLLRSVAGGTLFLDEIGELPLGEQAKLLRAIEEKRVLPLGADVEVECDFTLIAGTNRDLVQEVAAGRFREDLLARIAVWTVKLPGLAQRPEDIEPNLDYELERAARELGHHVWMSDEARDAFLAFAHKAPWPGNFRDFAAVITRMATLADGGRIGEEDVLDEVRQIDLAKARAPTSAPRARVSTIEELLGDRSLDRFERVQLEDVLEVVARTDSMAEAGRELFAHSRTLKTSNNDTNRLRMFLARYGLNYAQAKARLL